jgi:hypothetical protein
VYSHRALVRLDLGPQNAQKTTIEQYTTATVPNIVSFPAP